MNLHKAVGLNEMSGQYTGQSDARMLTPQELEGGFSAWTKKVTNYNYFSLSLFNF